MNNCKCIIGQRYIPLYFPTYLSRNSRFNRVTDIVFHCSHCRAIGNSMGFVDHILSCKYINICDHTLQNYDNQLAYPYKHVFYTPMKNNEFIVKMATIRLSYTQNKINANMFIDKYIEIEKKSVEHYILLKTQRSIMWE